MGSFSRFVEKIEEMSVFGGRQKVRFWVKNWSTLRFQAGALEAFEGRYVAVFRLELFERTERVSSRTAPMVIDDRYAFVGEARRKRADVKLVIVTGR